MKFFVEMELIMRVDMAIRNWGKQIVVSSLKVNFLRVSETDQEWSPSTKCQMYTKYEPIVPKSQRATAVWTMWMRVDKINSMFEDKN